MEKHFSLWQRIVSDTPAFFKWVQLSGLLLTAFGSALSDVANIPPNLTTALISAGSAVALIAQFAVKQYLPIQQIENDPK